MTQDKNKFYVTTPIYYVTARPHVGSLYSTVLADVAKRWNMLLGKKTFLLTGTDEHGQKVAQAAENAGKNPKEFVDSFIDFFKDTWNTYEIDYNYFIRTTDEQHIKMVQKWIKKLQDQGDIYLSTYTGWYCTPCETFVAEVHENEEEITCPTCGRNTVRVEEQCYFFKLASYQEKLLKLYHENPQFITPKERLAEVIKFVEGGLKDLCLSRTTITWGIPFPGDEKHVTYVWADALNNYITAIGWGDKNREEEFNFWWPADLQILGKDIVRFHAVYWPAFLMATGLALPKKLLVHGWIQMGGKKMSKSFGNVVDPQELLNAYGPDAVRFYLVRHMAVTQDSPFSLEDLEEKINAELADDLGNLLQRMISLAQKYNVQELKAPAQWSEASTALQEKSKKMIEATKGYFDQCYFHLAYAQLWKFINEVNSYFHSREPWRVAKTDMNEFFEILSATAHSLYVISYLAWPVMPGKMQELLKRLGKECITDKNKIAELETNLWDKTFILHQGDSLFKKYEVKKMETESVKNEPEIIAIEEFAKAHLVTGTIKECEPVPNSDKLYRLLVDCGSYGNRQILAGIQKHYAPTDLIDRQAVFLVNLKPRKMAGLLSEGMMLCAEDEGGVPVPTTPAKKVPNGTRLK